MSLAIAASLVTAQEPLPTPNEHRLDGAKLQDGDVLFIHSHSERAETISQVTGSCLTHCGIVFADGNGGWIVYEGAGRGRYLTLNEWQDSESTDPNTNKIEAYEPIFVRRLADIKSWSDQDRKVRIAALRAEAKKLHETRYDLGFAWNNHYSTQDGDYSANPQDPEYVYCSELVYKAFLRSLKIELAPLKKISDYQLTSQAQKFLNDPRAERERGGKPYDPSEQVVAPQDLYDSVLFESVAGEISEVSPR